MTSRVRVLCAGTATGARVQCGDIRNCLSLCEAKIAKNSNLAWGHNGIAQTGVTLAYTINPFGPSAGRVFVGCCIFFSSNFVISYM